MKSKEQIYEETQDLVLKTNTDNYMEYLKTFRQVFNSNMTVKQLIELMNSKCNWRNMY